MRVLLIATLLALACAVQASPIIGYIQSAGQAASEGISRVRTYLAIPHHHDTNHDDDVQDADDDTHDITLVARKRLALARQYMRHHCGPDPLGATMRVRVPAMHGVPVPFSLGPHFLGDYLSPHPMPPPESESESDDMQAPTEIEPEADNGHAPAEIKPAVAQVDPHVDPEVPCSDCITHHVNAKSLHLQIIQVSEDVVVLDWRIRRSRLSQCIKPHADCFTVILQTRHDNGATLDAFRMELGGAEGRKVLKLACLRRFGFGSARVLVMRLDRVVADVSLAAADVRE